MFNRLTFERIKLLRGENNSCISYLHFDFFKASSFTAGTFRVQFRKENKKIKRKVKHIYK